MRVSGHERSPVSFIAKAIAVFLRMHQSDSQTALRRPTYSRSRIVCRFWKRQLIRLVDAIFVDDRCFLQRKMESADQKAQWIATQSVNR